MGDIINTRLIGIHDYKGSSLDRYLDIGTNNDVDRYGNPAGGFVSGILRPATKPAPWNDEPRRVLDIIWQCGPIKEYGANGVQVEDVLEAARQRLSFLQTANGGKFWCGENDDALTEISDAIDHLNARTARRIREQTEGTNEGS